MLTLSRVPLWWREQSLPLSDSLARDTHARNFYRKTFLRSIIFYPVQFGYPSGKYTKRQTKKNLGYTLTVIQVLKYNTHWHNPFDFGEGERKNREPLHFRVLRVIFYPTNDLSLDTLNLGKLGQLQNNTFHPTWGRMSLSSVVAHTLITQRNLRALCQLLSPSCNWALSGWNGMARTWELLLKRHKCKRDVEPQQQLCVPTRIVRARSAMFWFCAIRLKLKFSERSPRNEERAREMQRG